MTRAEWTIAGHTVTSWGNGIAYAIKAPDGREVFLQGDDAAAWRDQYDAADATDAGAGPFLVETIANYGGLNG